MAESAEPAETRIVKSAGAFRTISEVAQELEVPQHVLRFWETKFSQVKPLKRGGGRRYYRPEDVLLLRRIRECLYQQGYTIKGVQKLLREGGLKSDASLAEASPSQGAMELAFSPPEAEEPGGTQPDNAETMLIEVLHELIELRDILRRNRR